MKKNNPNKDYVIALISGRTENRNPSINELCERVNGKGEVVNAGIPKQVAMEKEGLIKPALRINRAEFKKSDFEKKELKRLKAENKKQSQTAPITLPLYAWQMIMGGRGLKAVA